MFVVGGVVVCLCGIEVVVVVFVCFVGGGLESFDLCGGWVDMGDGVVCFD